MAGEKPKGDIKDLYAYYRFSDHKLTNIVLKDKTLFKSDVWFEGFMDWGFTRCTFTKAFYFGVEGEKLEEDTRGSEENAEPFPPYGSNGLNFDTCTMIKPFEIKDNCVVVFKDCTFNDTLTIEDNCRVEFIGCTFTKGIIFKTFCDVRFIRCSLTMTDYAIDAQDHCTFYFSNCTHGNAKDFQFRFTNDCHATFHAVEDTSISCEKTVFEVDDSSTVKVYNYTAMRSEDKYVLEMTGNSKFEFFNTSQFSVEKQTVFKIEDSELFLKDSATCSCGAQGQVLNAVNSHIRVKTFVSWLAQESDCIVLDNCKLSMDTGELIHSDQGKAINATDSEINTLSVETIDSGQGIAVFLTGTTVSLMRNGTLVNSGQKTAVYIENGAWGQFKETTTITSGNSVAIRVNDARYSDWSGDLRQGLAGGIVATTSTIELYNLAEVLGVEGIGISLTDCVYHLSYVVYIFGKLGGIVFTTCKGVFTYCDLIESGEGTAVVLAGCSGPTEWEGVLDIIAPLMPAMVVTGDLYGLRIIRTQRIFSEQNIALSWSQTGGEAYLADVIEITAPLMPAAVFSVAGKLRVEDVDDITSEESTALTISVTSGEAHFERVARVTAPLATALTVNVSAGALLRYNGFTSVTSEMGNALMGTCDGDLLVANGSEITTQMGLGTSITGSGGYSFARFADIQSISSQQPPDDMFEISGVAHVQVHRVASFSAEQSGRYVFYLRGAGEHIGRCEVIDCPSITGNQVRGGLYVQRFGWTEVICSKEPGAITIQEAGSIVCGITHTSGRMANYSEIKDSGQEARGLYSYGLGTSKANFRFENIDLIEAGRMGTDLLCDGALELHNVKEIKCGSEGEKGLYFSGEGTLKVTGGSQATVISGKDNNTPAIELANGVCTFVRVETEVSKGSIKLDSCSKVSFYNCTLKGTIKPTDSCVEFFNSETTSGYTLEESAVEWTKSTLNIGQDDGESKELLAHNCACKLIHCVVNGSEVMDFDDTNTFMMHVDGGGYSGELTFQRATLLMSARFSLASQTNVAEAAVILNSDFGDIGLTGGMFSANSAYKTVDVGEGMISTADRMDDLTLKDASGLILNDGFVDGVLTIGANCGLLANAGEVTGNMTLGANDAIITNGLTTSGGAVTLGSENAFIGNLLTLSSSLTTAADCGVMLCKADIGAALEIKSSSGAIVAKGDAASLNINAATSFIGAAVDAVPTTHDGSAVLVGANSQLDGTGQGLIITHGTFGKVDDDDGISGLRTGIMMDTEVIHLFNQYGHTGAAGDGCSMILGAKATGYAAAPQWLPSATDMVRSGVLIYDLATEIHHNLPEEDIPD